jgi:hypothetical protein
MQNPWRLTSVFDFKMKPKAKRNVAIKNPEIIN